MWFIAHRSFIPTTVDCERRSAAYCLGVRFDHGIVPCRGFHRAACWCVEQRNPRRSDDRCRWAARCSRGLRVRAKAAVRRRWVIKPRPEAATLCLSRRVEVGVRSDQIAVRIGRQSPGPLDLFATIERAARLSPGRDGVPQRHPARREGRAAIDLPLTVEVQRPDGVIDDNCRHQRWRRGRRDRRL